MKFNLQNVKLEDWNITGSELCQMTHKQVREKISSENFETFYTHLEMLRKHRYIAVLDENEREEANGSLKRNQKPSKYAKLRFDWNFILKYFLNYKNF